MSWYARKWWRFALAYGGGAETHWDGDGRWRHLVGPVWLLVDRGDVFGGVR